MTRVNAGIRPSELLDKLVIAEMYEMIRVPTVVRELLQTCSPGEILSRVPPRFTLGKGHVSFFYDKNQYLHRRYNALHREALRRGIESQHIGETHFSAEIPEVLYKDWAATVASRRITLNRFKVRGHSLRRRRLNG